MTAWCLRFYRNARSKEPEQRLLHFTLRLEEIEEAKLKLVRLTQQQHFREDIRRLEQYRELSSKSILLDRRPFIDKHGILHIGGHFQQANVGFSLKQPIIMHPKAYHSKLLVHHLQVAAQHAGPTILLDYSLILVILLEPGVSSEKYPGQAFAARWYRQSSWDNFCLQD